MKVEPLVVEIVVDTSKFQRAVSRITYRHIRWAWQPSDDNPMPSFHLFRRTNGARHA